MTNKNKERRIININKLEFDIIKKYCDENALKMSSWIAKIAIEKIEQIIK